ncbi:MAG: response regulator transcription factor [Gammaproteobacteria bacterium]
MKVLIAEDTESVRGALRMAMDHLGHEVVGCAVNGRDAIEQYETTRPEIVLMDVRMPKMDGLTATTELARRDPDAKVVIVTATRTTKKEAHDAGARGYVEKPFAVADLADEIQRASR